MGCSGSVPVADRDDHTSQVREDKLDSANSSRSYSIEPDSELDREIEKMAEAAAAAAAAATEEVDVMSIVSVDTPPHTDLPGAMTFTDSLLDSSSVLSDGIVTSDTTNEAITIYSKLDTAVAVNDVQTDINDDEHTDSDNVQTENNTENHETIKEFDNKNEEEIPFDTGQTHNMDVTDALDSENYVCGWETRPTRWEALADVAAELPAKVAVDPLTGQMYALTRRD